MALTTYTSNLAIRSILGVSDLELTDEVLAQPELEMQFQIEMNNVDGGGGAVLSQYNTILSIQEASRTADQTLLFNLVRMLAGYSVAKQLLASAPMFAPQVITDGKAQQQRADNPWDRLTAGVYARYTSMLKSLKTVLLRLDANALVVLPTSRTFITTAPIGTDPVTGS